VVRFVWALLLCITLHVGAQPDSARLPADSLSHAPLIRSDSLAAAVKMAALDKILQGQPSTTARIESTYQPPSLGRLALKMMVGLGVVLFLIYVLYRLARRARGMDVKSGDAPTRLMQVLETSFVGPNQRLVMVRVGANRILVVGSTPEQVHTLADIQGEEALNMLEQSQTHPISPAQFSETVNHLLRRFRKDAQS
jgi:flagellar biogenesis protein FliO